jgi:hypothetical protein
VTDSDYHASLLRYGKVLWYIFKFWIASAQDLKNSHRDTLPQFTAHVVRTVASLITDLCQPDSIDIIVTVTDSDKHASLLWYGKVLWNIYLFFL